MTRRTLARPARNPPRQSRSRFTVASILDATVRILEQEGSEAATTTRIAEVAGVGVGTLYQYFSNRDAILDALREREFERATEFLQRVFLQSAPGTAAQNDAQNNTARALARRVIEGLLELYAACPALHRLLVVEGLRVAPTEPVQAFDLRMVSAIRAFLGHARLPLRRANLDAAAFVIYHSVRATMLARLLEAPAGLDDAAIVDELTDLLVRYLITET
jgi:AcrR family transcriptional regulator